MYRIIIEVDTIQEFQELSQILRVPGMEQRVRDTVANNILNCIPAEPKFVTTTEIIEILRNKGKNQTPRAVQAMLQRLCKEFPIVCMDGKKPYKWQWKT
jgi:hypothetical protein